MADSDALEAKLDTLAEYVERIDDQLEDEFVEGIVTADDGEVQYLGHRCFHGDNVYLIAGHPDEEYIRLMYFLSTVQNIAGALPEEVAREMVAAEDTEADVQSLAATKLLDEVDREIMNRFHERILLYTISESFGTTIHTNDADSVTHVELEKRIFPADPNFSISKFNTAVQALISGGVRARSVFRQSLHLSVDEEHPEETEFEITPL